ncbi:unnamed protein product [Phytophthora fragariaefolia]|uniref:Unnamed protein product n=1 Tax=Phytophthora fragariaefolia TaxID=1490495 RepID=A0A9W6XN23_9STRA|nr:unnamed protein product [Phytophthora fragariaefolia]
MEVGREASAAAASAEGSAAVDAVQRTAERIRELKEERQQWIAKRQQALARQEKLLKLLELQRAKQAEGEQNAANATEMGAPTAGDTTSRDDELKAAAAQARKKELKELQARAQAAQEVRRLDTSRTLVAVKR